MDTTFMNSRKSKTFDSHRLILNLTNKILKRRDKYVALSNFSVYYTQKCIRKSYKSNKFEVSAPTWNKKMNYLMDPCVSYIQDYSKYNIKKYEAVSYSPPKGIYINKIGLRLE